MKPRKQTHPDPAARYWRLPAVLTYVGRSRSAVYADQTFPRPIRLSANASAWLASEVRAWCAEREAEAGRVAA